MAYSGYTPEDFVRSQFPVEEPEPQTVGLVSLSTQTMVPKRSWRGGAKIKWLGNDLVKLKCQEGNSGPPIIVRIQEFSEKDHERFQCQDGTMMAEPLFQFINKHLKTCLHKGMRAGQMPGQIKNIAINSKGVTFVRRARGERTFSQHSTGRAIDVVDFNVTLEDGSKLTLPASCIKNPPGSLREPGFRDIKTCDRVGPMGQFYDTFTQCWQDSVEQEKKRCDGLKDSFCKDLQDNTHCGKENGALGCDDPDGDHKDHLHLALPLCPPQKGIATT